MTTFAPLSFCIGEEWFIPFVVNDQNAQPVDLSDPATTIRWRMSGPAGEIMTRSLGDGITIENAAGGFGKVRVTPTMQDADAVAPGLYEHACEVFTPSSGTSVQFDGSIEVRDNILND